MFDIDRWAEIWASISSNLLRTFLSGITIALALFVFITLFGLSKGLQNGFAEEFFPPNVKSININPGRTSLAFKGQKSDRLIEFDNADYNFLKEEFNDQIKYITPVLSKSLTARNFSEYGDYSIQGIIPEQLIKNESKLIAGRSIDDVDRSQREKNVVIGRLVQKDLYKNGSAVGKPIQLGNTMYNVVGVFSDADGDNEERIIYIPLETLQVIYGTDKIDNFSITPQDDLSLDQISDLSQEIKEELKARKSVSPDDETGIRIWDPKKGLETTNMFFLIFTIIVFVIGIGSLIAGIVSIGNMMVFGVKERTKEIGVRKALGAQPSNIVGLILQEAMLITILFGAIGIGLALFVVNLIEDDLKEYLIINPQVETRHIIMATIILFLSGLLAGFIPARRAARIKPIDALRDE